ncbi:probable 2-oxoglutarate-dependent dioxygenase AOP1 [Syzygium oleosum]|uniref:probable 2-oxoglutarate-dependent dioxygenase AOP1 n=1 Tax=Syzygium oleosum TaxID=219896 RepID=UPI0011D2A8A6|nr:probable 2-oxoglutarate-dependent dioxygenase AOP1 [Syzygium oleosum]
MGSMTELKLPFIDCSSPWLEPGTAEWTTVRDEVKQALETYGCFEARFEKVPVELQESMLGSVREVFDLPLQTKLRNVSRKPYHGYVGQYPMVPLYESIGIDDADMYEKVDGVTTTLWPEGYPNFSKTIQSFSEKLSELDKMIRRMILETFGVEKYLDEHMNSTNYLLRVMKYEGPQTTDTKLGLMSHTDKNILTILCQNEVAGLQLQSKEGEWICARPSTNSFIVMIGESLYAWVNGRLHSPHHRVMMSGNKARYSVGLFSIPKGGYIVKAPDELVDEEHPLLFKPFDHVEFLGFYYTEAGQRAESALKTYCGV